MTHRLLTPFFAAAALGFAPTALSKPAPAQATQVAAAPAAPQASDPRGYWGVRGRDIVIRVAECEPQYRTQATGYCSTIFNLADTKANRHFANRFLTLTGQQELAQDYVSPTDALCGLHLSQDLSLRRNGTWRGSAVKMGDFSGSVTLDWRMTGADSGHIKVVARKMIIFTRTREMDVYRITTPVQRCVPRRAPRA